MPRADEAFGPAPLRSTNRGLGVVVVPYHRRRAGRVQISDRRAHGLQDGAARAELRGNAAPASPPPTQLMERLSSSDSSGAEEAGDPDRIPAAVFERDPSESNKDWSMMSTESVFGLQVAPSSDFTGFFLAHPELMDIATPPRSSSAAAVLDADAKAAPVILPPFESIPELPESAMKGNYSFAFPNLIEDKRNYSKKQSQREHQPEPAAPMEAAEATPAPAQAEAKGPATSSKPEAAPASGVGKGGLFSCFPCC